MRTQQHTFRLERMDMSEVEADQIKTALEDFLVEGVGFRPERISELECRSRDGFIPYSHNYGGLEGIGFIDQVSAESVLSGIFEKSHNTLEKYRGYDFESFKQDKGLSEKLTESELTDEQDQDFYEYRSQDSESSVLLSVDAMLTGPNSLNIRLCVCVSDAPYHRTYDDMREFNIEFSSTYELVVELDRILKDNWVDAFSQAASETY